MLQCICRTLYFTQVSYAAFQCMLQYIYGGAVDVPEEFAVELLGLADRYLQLKRVLKHMNETDLDMTWSYYHDGMSPSDTHHVCDWSGVESGSMQMPTCTPGSCSGHRKDDSLPMSNFLDKNGT